MSHGEQRSHAVIFHGALVMLAGLLCGVPTVNEEEPARLWHTAVASISGPESTA